MPAPIPVGHEDVQDILEVMYRQLWGVCVFIGQKLGKQPKCCPHCNRPLKDHPQGQDN